MKTGKISQSIYDRSVCKVLTIEQSRILKGAEQNCAFFADCFALGQMAFVSEDVAVYAFYDAYNQMLASGGTPRAAMVSLTLTTRQSEAFLKRVIRAISEVLEKTGVQMTSCQVEVVDAVMPPMASVSMIGSGKHTRKQIEPGLDIVMTKTLANGATAMMAQLKKEELSARFPYYFVQKALEKRELLSVQNELTLTEEDYLAIPISKGGVFGALWQLGEAGNVGMEIHLRQFPISQETIEFCELYELNPYELYGLGGLLMVSKDGNALVERLGQAGIRAAHLGTTSACHDRVIVTAEEKRFLEPVKPDELLKLIYRGE